MSIKKIIELYSENKITEANALLESVLLEKIQVALENKKQNLFSEGDTKINNKKKKNKLTVRAGKTIGGISAKHSGRTLFRTLQPSQLKKILATEEILSEAKPMPYKDVHKMLVDAGFKIIGQDGTSHIKYKHPKTGETQSVVHHGKEVSVGIVGQCLKKVKAHQAISEQYRPVGFHKNATKGLKYHLRFVHPIQKQRKNRRFYKNLQKRLDRK